MIASYEINIDNFIIRLSDNFTDGRFQENPNKYNLDRNINICKINGCNNTFNRNRQSGLCDDHQLHEHDLFLEVLNTVDRSPYSFPTHKEIIDALMDWSSTRNFSLNTFFSKISFNVLGNIPDVTSLSGDIEYTEDIIIPTIEDIFTSLLPIIYETFPLNNTSSYQKLKTNRGNISAISLAHIMVGLLICEEANRGDRWFFRNIIKDESKTSYLGAAMPLAYFATKTFSWGVEMNKKVSRNLTR